MLFNSQIFLIVFLPLVIGAYYWVAANPMVRRWLLISASLIFYGYWDIRFVPLLVGSVCVNWAFARLFGRYRRPLLLGMGVALNLLIIGVFKYFDFFVDSLTSLTGMAHEPWNIILPLGISFFTFQQISYLIDLRRLQAPLYSFPDYALYVTFFPQLIAGPIVRHNQIIYQFGQDPFRDGLHERLSRGLSLFVIGLFKKVALADSLGGIADPLYAGAVDGQSLLLGEAWVAAVAFGLQIYFDFSGYSDMAIGLGLLFGLQLPVNFNAPYIANSIRDFWRRWHMTLSSFLRDYLYIPFGGSRHGLAQMSFAILATMLLGGLWHGAGWTFVIWGGLHGMALIANHAWNRWRLPMPHLAGWLLTMLFVFSAWVLFRAETFGAAIDIWTAMVGGHGWSFSEFRIKNAWVIPVAAAIAIIGPTSQRAALERLTPRRSVAALVAVILVALTLHIGGGKHVEFIYFQF